jgi:hypothetical protein
MLDEGISRRGVKIEYPLGDARMTLEISPDADAAEAWDATINRHYAEVPTDEGLVEAVSWFAALNDELPRLVRKLIMVPEAEGAEHAA